MKAWMASMIEKYTPDEIILEELDKIESEMI